MKRGTRLQIPCLYNQSTRDLVPVIVAFTKFDTRIRFESFGAESHEIGKVRADAHYEEKLRPSLRNDKVPTAVVYGSSLSLWNGS